MNTITITQSEFTETFILEQLEQFPVDQDVTIDFTAEAHVYCTKATLQPMIYTLIHKACEQLNREPETVTYLTGNVREAECYDAYCSQNNIENRLNVQFAQFWMYIVRESHGDLSWINNLSKDHIRSKYFTYLNKASRDNRIFLWEELCSLSMTNDDLGYITAHWLDKDLNEGSDDWHSIYTHTNNFHENFIKVHTDSYFDIVTETLAGFPFTNSTKKLSPDYWREIFFTEKTFRCIKNMRPFILYGNQYSYRTLHEWGFKTFDGVMFDESFDSLYNAEERAVQVAEQIQKFIRNNTIGRVHDIVYSDEVQNILQHNRDRFLEITQENHHQQPVDHFMLNMSMNISLDKPELPLITLQNTDFQNEDDYYNIAKKLKTIDTDIKEAGAVIIDYSFEAPSIRQFGDSCVHIYDLIYDNLDKMVSVQPQQIIYITGNQYESENYARWHQDNPHRQQFMNVTGRQTQIPATYYCEDLSFTSEGGMFKSKYALTMHRRPGIHRVELLNQMYKRNLIDDKKIISKFNWEWDKHKSVVAKSPNDLEHILPKNTPEDDQICYSDNYPQYYKDMFADSYYSIESETQADVYLETPGAIIKELYPWWRRMYFTEKIWRNIYWKRPFLLIGDYGMLEQLKEYGFQSLHGVLWDESYDLEPDWNKRISLMLDQHEYIINNYTLEQLHNKIYSKEVQDILEFNRQEFIKIAKGHK